ncbi:sterol-binding protein [Shewanella sp. Scap07]|uniref:ubiquinone biosynthesis accessory factor UbiJ n=1 Tax=Shewanella sp. Scap07 TaxID=2589987 RepID=UPI0015BEF061|nr:SCP2 sterol-binding domain-containing protein [Shewanella sp. Scap07]QLE84071.1 sterol-binding protein [Shewanella sp. Scap07]
MKRDVSLLVCGAIETALDKILTQSHEAYAKSHTLHGKVLCLQLSQLDWPIYLIFSKNVQVYSRYAGDVTTTVYADITTLYQLTEGANLTELIKQDKLRLEGDLNLLQTFSHLLQNIDIDLAEPISKYLGDAPTHLLQHGFSQAKQTLTQVFVKSRDHVGQLTTEEYRLAPHKLEFIHLSDRIDELVADVDAIEQRISRLTNRT